MPPCEPNDRELIVCDLQVPSSSCGSVISNPCAPISSRMSHECTMCPFALGSFLVLNCISEDVFFSPCSCAALSGARTGGTQMRGKYPADEEKRGGCASDYQDSRRLLECAAHCTPFSSSWLPTASRCSEAHAQRAGSGTLLWRKFIVKTDDFPS